MLRSLHTTVPAPFTQGAGGEGQPGGEGHALLALSWNPAARLADFPQVLADARRAAAERTPAAPLILQKALTSDGWRLEGAATQRLLDKLRRGGKPLGEYVGGRFYYGIKTGLNEAFVVDRATRDALIAEHAGSAELLKPFLRGRDVKRWRVAFAELYLCYVGWHTPIDKYPAIKRHLQSFENDLRTRPETREGRVPWYAMSRYAADYWQEFAQPKILYQEIATYQAFAWDDAGFYSNNKTFLIPATTKFLLAVLNSKVAWHVLGSVATKLQGGAYQMQMPYVSQIPIPAASSSGAIEALVTQILAAKAAKAAADVAAQEREIDERVYALYGLRPDEIRMIEESVAATKTR